MTSSFFLKGGYHLPMLFLGLFLGAYQQEIKYYKYQYDRDQL